MKEIWDAYRADGTLAYCDLVRDEPIPEGLYHLVCEILVRHTDGDYLLMHRDPGKRNYGGWYEATAGGSALKGEDALTSAFRELREETGITALSLTPISKYTSHNTHYHSFLCITDCGKDDVVLQPGETDGYKWLTEPEFISFVRSDAIMPNQLRLLTPYLHSCGYL